MTHIQTRRGSAGAWSTENPVLMEGEVGIETGTRKTKQGDGVTAWNDLPYATAPLDNAALTGTPTAPTAAGGTNTTQVATTAYVQGELSGLAPTASPTFTGTPTAPTPSDPDDDTTQIPTTEWVNDAIAAAIGAIGGVDILDAYPVGSIFMSVDNTDPGTIFGGTWSAWGSGRVPVGVDAGQTEFNSVEEVGGAKTHTLVAAEMPSHTHTGPSHTHAGPSHTHALNIEWREDADTVGEGTGHRVVDVGGVTGGSGASSANATTGASGTGNTGAGGTGNTGSAGSDTAHNNLQPYITCYMFKRTA